MTHCVYLDEDSLDTSQPLCYQYGKCRVETPTGSQFPNAGIPSCNRCQEKLLTDDPELIDKFRDPLRITDKDERNVTCLEGILKNHGKAFLVCGGPSAKGLPMEQLNKRGCWSLGVNNVAGWSVFRPQAFVHSDPPSKFHNGIWTDPGIMKFVPIPKMKRKRGRLRKKYGEKDFRSLLRADGVQQATCDCPNTLGLFSAWLVATR